MSTPDLPLALRPTVATPPRRNSVFEDPSDEKSWHVSQRFESLSRFYEGREPSWYASAVRPLRGVRRVLDLGSGPGLAMRALREDGAERCIGLDRWPGFVARGTGDGIETVLHDLTLPAPFLSSRAVDGVFSHFVLDYISPIGVRQLLREARRVLEPGGRMLLHLAAVGLAGGDETRTVPYGPDVMRTLLLEAAFTEFEVEQSPNLRNVTVNARAGDAPAGVAAGSEVTAEVHGEVQLDGAFVRADAAAGTARLEIEAAGTGRSEVIAFDVVPYERLGFCVRVIPVAAAARAAELQVCVWSGARLAHVSAMRIDVLPNRVSVRFEGSALDHSSVWHPEVLALEPPGDAHSRVDELPPIPEAGSPDEWGAERRLVIVEPEGGLNESVAAVLGRHKNRFLLRRARAGARWAQPAELEEDWLAERAHGLVLAAADVAAPDARGALLWALHSEALVYVEASDWGAGLEAVTPLAADARGPVFLVDPALCTAGAGGGVPDAVIRASEELEPLHLVLAGASAADTSAVNVLIGGDSEGVPADVTARATETLRWATDRAVVMRMRRRSALNPAELGRRPPLG